MYSYQKTEPGQWSVGMFTKDGEWQTESVWYTSEEAAERAHWLNGGKPHKWMTMKRHPMDKDNRQFKKIIT
ncbi:MAG: hypothetical protein ACFWUC_12560 [Oscillospiraceae bacterium]|jgi:hypothetical protein